MAGLILVFGVAFKLKLKPWIIFIALILGLKSDFGRS